MSPLIGQSNRSFLERVLGKLHRMAAWQRRRSLLRSTMAKKLDVGYLHSLELCLLIEPSQVKQIWDVGANRGTWTDMVEALFPGAHVVQFEPIPSLVEGLEDDAFGKERTVISSALGSKEQELELTITSNLDSSSLLKPNKNLETLYGVTPDEVIRSRVVTGDSIISDQKLPAPDLLKLDVQGFELEVLEGLKENLHCIGFVIAELSFVQQYDNQPLAHEIISMLSSKGFDLWAFGSETVVGARLIEVDCLFVNRAVFA